MRAVRWRRGARGRAVGAAGLAGLIGVSCHPRPPDHETAPRVPSAGLVVADVGPHVDLGALRRRIERAYGTTLPRARGAVVIAVVDPDTELVTAHGQLSPSDARVPDESTVFEVGSITKVMTGVALGEAVAEHRVALEDDAQRYLPNVRLPTYHGQAIRLLDLATYSSGLPAMPTNWIRVDEGVYTPEMWRAFLAGYTLPHAPGQGFEYSNVAFGVLGDALAAREGTSLGEVYRQRLFRPLGMDHSWLLGQRPAAAQVAQGTDDHGTLVPLDFDKPLQAGCCAMESTAHDLLAFLRAHWESRTPPALREALQRAATTYRSGEGDFADVDVGLGWFVDRQTGALTKSGLMKGYRSGVAIDRERRAGAVVLAADAQFPSEVLAVEAMRALITTRDHPPVRTVAGLPADATGAFIEWEPGLRLLGWSAPARVKRGETVSLRYFYQLTRPLDADYRIFVHADGGGERINADHRPLPATIDWPVGAIIEDDFTIRIPSGQPGNKVRVWSGFLRNGRMKVATRAASDGDDRVRGPLLVVEP